MEISLVIKLPAPAFLHFVLGLYSSKSHLTSRAVIVNSGKMLTHHVNYGGSINSLPLLSVVYHRYDLLKSVF